MTPAQLVTQVLQLSVSERARIVEACAVLAPHMPLLDALGGVEVAAEALSVVTPTETGRPCDRCYTVIEGRDNRTKFCESCSKELKRERGQRSNKARDGRVSLSQGFRQGTRGPAPVEYSCEEARETPAPTPLDTPAMRIDDPHRWCATCQSMIDHRPRRARYCEDCAQARPTTAQTRVMKSSSSARDALLALQVGS